MTVHKQPKAFYMIFFLEFWERFGFSGFNCMLTLFFVKSLGFSDTQSFATFGAFTALLCGLMSVGGFIADKVLGIRRTIILGALTLMAGYFVLSVSNNITVFYALGIICVGNGLFKPNPSNLLSRFYSQDDPRLHSAFTMYYMAINLGSFFAVISLPKVAAVFGWNSAFLISGIGMIVAILNYTVMKKTVKGIDNHAGTASLKLEKIVVVGLGMIIAVIICNYLLHHVFLAKMILWIFAAVITGIYFFYLFKEHGASRRKMVVAFILMLEAVIFFTLYQQMPMSLNFFAIKNVDPHVFGINIDPQSFQSLNAFWIVVLSPILAIVYNHLGSKKKDMSMAAKFSLGMTLCAFSFIILYFPRYFASAEGTVSPIWLVMTYFLQSIGELLVSALGMAMVAELVPQKIMGFIMGMWFLTIAVSGVTGSIVASFTVPAGGGEAVTALVSLNLYTKVFLEIGLITLVIAVIMWLTAPILNKYMKVK